jgi:hypothetical protein
MNETTPSPLGNVITIDDERNKNHLDRVVRGSVSSCGYRSSGHRPLRSLRRRSIERYRRRESSVEC